ncbi:hypothetical protein HXX76_004797 [Chlamydomonas incerta]|uniref:Protein kinase domain-containing protein n=1 Tax=Chlamydomonas incerta TaxID=51695 RepID=A0A835T8K4_CHLIN|nr:hypothetical protein HXX76_004797 [Chlamydomonas incerta]|eukprot:KAG2439441.1 hypothetical protein HXX76_004797 [Chlamydomonas incerta]
MGCASSVPAVQEPAGPPPAGPAAKRQEVYAVKEKETPGEPVNRSHRPSAQEAAFASELAKLIAEATSGQKPKDAWVILYRCADLVCSAFGFKTCSLVIYTTSGLYCKLAVNSGSPLNELVSAHPDLLPAEALGWVSAAVASGKTVCCKSGDDAWTHHSNEAHPDFALLSGPRGGCSSLAVLPLVGGQKCPGALLLGHTAPLSGFMQQSWLSTLLPLLSLYVVESYLVRNLSIIEKVVEVVSLNSLAYAVTSELGDIFEWCHKDDVEARLVVLSPEGDTATVYCKVCAANVYNDDRTSLRSGMSSGVSGQQRSGNGTLLEEGLVGTHMSLDNTLTKRCLTGRQRLLFVADVMQALKLYGEPWKDIFFDNAAVLTPCWVLAAPLVQDGKKLGAVLWLSSCRVNSDVLMRTASTCASPIIHAVTRCAALHQALAAGGTTANGNDSAYGRMLPGTAGNSQYGANGTAAAAGAAAAGGGGGAGGLSSFTQLSSRQSSTLSRGRTGRLGGAGAEDGTLPGRSSTDAEALADTDGQSSRAAQSVPDIPVKYVLRHSPSTSALMRMYKSTIAQRAPPTDDDRSTGSVHEIRILSKAGEGAFGSVYVGRWRNIVVAVKIIKDTSGTRSLKTAWELAVNKSLSHPSIVTVHAILTDVHLQKTSTRVLRFVPAAALEAQQTAAVMAAAAANAAAGTGSTGGSGGSPAPTGGAAPSTPNTTTRLATVGGASDAGGGASGLLPTKGSAPTPGAGGDGAQVGPQSAGPGVGVGAGGMLPNFSRTSAGSIGAPSAAMLKPTKPITPKVHAILMEYCNLGGLHKYIDNRMFFKDRTMPDKATEAARATAPLPAELVHMDFVLATLSEVASALQYLHAQGFVHCDLKPENVLLKEANNRRGFTAKLADFGLSELRSADGQVVGDLGGTVTHVAPESVLHRQVSSFSDMYAFGILMWELYTGQQPYRALLSHISKREDRHRALLARVVHEGLRPIFPPGVPQDYWTLAVQCWSAEPTARPTTGEVLQALEAMYAKYATPAPQGQDNLNTPA